jgi:uncharacterized protein (DUF2147 family)
LSGNFFMEGGLRMKRIVTILLFIMAWGGQAYGSGIEDVLGVWNNQEKDAKIEIMKCNEKYCGKIVWLKDPHYPPDSKDGVPGTPKLDHNNPSLELRNVPIVGLVMIRDFDFIGDNVWKNGKIYDPKNGKTYSASMTLVSPTQLNLRGFIGISLIGRTTTWTR